MSRVNVRVRPAEPADVPALVELTRSADLSSGTFSGRALLDDRAEHLTERIAEILRENERILLVAVDDMTSALVGLLVARTDDIGAIDLTPVLHVTHLIVLPKQRRRGIGRTLLAAAVHLAEERGVDRVLATAASGSREGNRYLARLGFAPLVVHRIASTSVLRRSLGMSEAPERMAVLRRARLIRAQRAGLSARAARRGA
ncbi:MAG TPA: GNAT family N-acetyltransferase [Jatrophihabitantaceae bacterium]|nr:GNAT family N-acetyltransferase [Jatrophihabitantaceae bacterium]